MVNCDVKLCISRLYSLQININHKKSSTLIDSIKYLIIGSITTYWSFVHPGIIVIKIIDYNKNNFLQILYIF